MSSQVMVGELLDLVEQDYKRYDRKSIASLKSSCKHLRKFFNEPAEEVSIIRLNAYIDFRKSQAANTSINREVYFLKRAYDLGIENKVIATKPVFPKALDESASVREGYAEHEEFLKVKQLLDPIYRRPFIVGYYTGRRRGEILTFRKEQVDLKRRIILASKKNTKTKQGGVIALTDEAFEAVKEAYDSSSGPFLFQRATGKRISNAAFYENVKLAFACAGVRDRNFHDFRRTVSRNVLKITGNEKLAMATTGHTTRKHFDRYNIVIEDDLVEMSKRYQKYLDGSQKQKSNFDGGISATKEHFEGPSNRRNQVILRAFFYIWSLFGRLWKEGA